MATLNVPHRIRKGSSDTARIDFQVSRYWVVTSSVVVGFEIEACAPVHHWDCEILAPAVMCGASRRPR